MDTADLLSYLSGGTTFREKYLPEAEDFLKQLGVSKSDTISQGLINPLKNEMLARAAMAKGMMGSV